MILASLLSKRLFDFTLLDWLAVFGCVVLIALAFGLLETIVKKARR